MSLLLAIRGWDVAPWRRRFAALAPDRDIVEPGQAFDRAAVRYAVTWRHPPGALADLPNLEIIFSLGAGVDHLLTDTTLPDRPIVRVVDSDLRDRMSEWVVMHALMHLRQVRRYDDQQRRRLWEDDDDQPAARDVSVGVLGLGVLGQDAAAKLKAMGFRVSGWSASPKRVDGIETFDGAGGLDAFLAGVHILVALLPLTPETRGLLNAPLFSKLRPGGPLGGPILINAGRGGLQVEADIVAALASGALKGASLDVFEREPLSPESSLWAHPSVYVTPHNAAMSAPDSIARGVVEQILAHERGEPLRNLVDRARGY